MRVEDFAHVADPAARQAISEKAVCAVRLADLLEGPPSRREARDTRSAALGSSKLSHPSCAVTTQPAGALRSPAGGVGRARGGRRRRKPGLLQRLPRWAREHDAAYGLRLTATSTG